MNKIPNYLEQLIDSVPNNSTIRFNCPELNCRGKNSLGITKENGKVQWNCFKLNCKLHGKIGYVRTTSELKSHINDRTAAKQEFRLPEYLIHGLGSKKCLTMITNSYCVDAYKSGLFDIAYDPVQDRVCFVVKQGNEIVGLIGKALASGIQPKVLNYPNSDISVPFICGNSKTIVLVEDCLSAASVTRIKGLSGLALLGSTIKNEYIPSLKQYDTVIVALDRDARKKALAIKTKLCYYHSNIKLWLLDKDIKNQTTEELTSSFERI